MFARPSLRRACLSRKPILCIERYVISVIESEDEKIGYITMSRSTMNQPFFQRPSMPVSDFLPSRQLLSLLHHNLDAQFARPLRQLLRFADFEALV